MEHKFDPPGHADQKLKAIQFHNIQRGYHDYRLDNLVS
jgi:hypothetical protein